MANLRARMADRPAAPLISFLRPTYVLATVAIGLVALILTAPA